MPHNGQPGLSGDAGRHRRRLSARRTERGPRLDMLPPELWSGVRGFVRRAFTSNASRLPYDYLSDIGGALMVLGLLVPMLILAGQTVHWLHRDKWPSERVSLLWDALSLPYPPASWAGVQLVLDVWLATPLWLGVMGFLLTVGYGIRAAANMLRRSATR